MRALLPVILTVAAVLGLVIGVLLVGLLAAGARLDPQREDRRLARRHGEFE